MFAHTFCKYAWLARFENLMLIDFCESYADKENYTRGSRRICVLLPGGLCFLLD